MADVYALTASVSPIQLAVAGVAAFAGGVMNSVAGGGTLAVTGAPALGWVILLGIALLLTGFVVLRNSRLKSAKRGANRDL